MRKKSGAIIQKTGASLRNNRASSFFTQRITAFAALTIALFGSAGETDRYSSKGWVI